MSPTSNSVILVTGASGFVGSHIVSQLLDAGYKVRAMVRPGKAALIKSTYPTAGSKLEVYEVTDLAGGRYPEAFDGVGALIHVAAANYWTGKPNSEVLAGAVDNAINAVNQAIAAGVKKIIATSSVVALFDPDMKRAFESEPLNEDSWSKVTLEQITTGLDEHPSSFVYIAGKAVAERQLWEIAAKHPDVDVTTIVPPVIYGSWVPNYPRPANRESISTADFAYELITGGPDGPNTYPSVPFSNVINVKDVAKAHVLALNAPARKDGKQKRLPISIPGLVTSKMGADLLRKERPHLAGRLPPVDLAPPQQTIAPVDTSFAAEVLGLKEYIPWDTTLLETIDNLVQWEKGSQSA